MKDVGWIPTGELSSGDPVKLKSDEYVPIDAYDVIILDELIKVYNFEVEDNHNYYVSENEVLVHNGYEERRTSRQAFRAAKREVGIPTSAQFDNHKFVFDGSTENRRQPRFRRIYENI